MKDPKTVFAGGVRLRHLNWMIITVAVVVSVVLVFSVVSTVQSYRELQEDTRDFRRAEDAVMLMREASDYLTREVQLYVVTGEWAHAERYFEETEVNRRRDAAIATLQEIHRGEGAVAALREAMDESSRLMEMEYHAMALVLSSAGETPADVPAAISGYPLTEEERALSPEEKRARALALVFGDEYAASKQRIWDGVQRSADQLGVLLDERQDGSSAHLRSALVRQMIMTAVLLALLLTAVILVAALIIHPLSRFMNHVRASEPAEETGGSYEMRFLAREFNLMYDRLRNDHEQLSFEAYHDPLTGVNNRKVFEQSMEEQSRSGAAMGLIIVDVDDFKHFNDHYGHATGDAVLKRVAAVLQSSFRSEDRICRIGGDEFVVLMNGTGSGLSELVLAKMARVAETLLQPAEDVPPIGLSVGIAFADRQDPTGSLFEDADKALYMVKDRGGNDRQVYGAE